MRIVSLSVSRKKGVRKKQVDRVVIIPDHGIEGDAHAGEWHRQLSFLAAESIEKTRQAGLKVSFGDFAENIATQGIDWTAVPVGTRFRLGKSVLVEITQIGKKCHNPCAIYYHAGDCIMPKEGVFARVLQGGVLHAGDSIRIVPDGA